MNNKIRFYGIQLLIPLFLFAFQNHGISQCTVLGHAIQISEFGCSNDIGKICLFTVADKLPTNHTWTAKLEYPFGSFIYTDLGDFALVSSNPNGNVVLAGDILLYSDGVIGLCLEGTEQIPGTSYTMSIVNELGDVAFVRTFTLSTKAIGNANQTILASDVIANGDLLPSTSSSNGQHIRIEGKLIFDIDYNFGWSDHVISEIIMGENASIEVGSDTRLVMDRVLVHGCNDVRWDKILLQSESEMEVCVSTFRDAKKAIVLGEMGDFTSKASLYENNLIGLESVGTPGNKNDTDIHFYGSAWYPNVFRQGRIGLNLDYTYPQTISGTGLKFENLNQGIRVFHGGLTITSTSFNSSGVSFSNCYSAVSSRYNSLLSIYGAEMYNCYFGFTDAYSQEEIIRRSMIQTTKMPFVKYAAENSHTLISDNHTISSRIDLYGWILPSRAEIQNNRFGANSLNILLYGYGKGEQKWAIQNNPEITGFENSGNITLNNMHNSKVFRNTMYAEGTSPYDANIKIYGGSNNKIGYNNLDVGYSSHGIVVNNSTKGLLYCNHVAGGNSSAPSALEVKGECMGTEIRGNDISGSGSFNLTYGNPNSAYANTGNQPFKGNIYANSSPSSTKAAFYGNASLVENNKFQVAPINNQGNAYFPYNTAPTNNWFNNQAWGEDYTCPPGKPGLLSPEKQLDDLFSLTNLVDNSIAANYHPEIEWGAKLKLYTFLSDYKTNYNTLPSSLGSRLTSMQGSIYAQFYDFDKRYMLAIEENEDERARNKILSDEVIRIMDEIDTIEWFELDTITGSFKIHTEQYGHYKSLKKEIRDLSLKLEDIQKKVQQDKLAALPSLQTLNSSIVSDGSVSAENLKAVNDIWINMSMNENSLTDSDVEQLKSIANQCATLGGEGVFRARSLLASMEHDNFEIPNEYNDDCLSSALGNNFEDNTATNTNKIMLSPNPATDYVYIVSEKAFGVESIEVRNKLGELIKRIKINPESNSHNFDVSNWNEGIYYLRVNAGERMHKLTVIRQ